MATALSVLKKALCLGHCGKTTTVDDVAPASYELEVEVHAKTCEKYAVVLRAVYTVTVGSKKKTEPLLLQAKKREPKPMDGGCPSHVKELVEHHVSAVAAGMTAEQMFAANGSSILLTEALGRVNQDLAKSQSGGGRLFVCCTRIERFTVDVPSNKPSMVGFTQRIMAPVLVVDHATLMTHWNNQMAYWNNHMAYWAYWNNQRSWCGSRRRRGDPAGSGSMKVQGQKNSSMAGFTQRTSVQVHVNNASVRVAVAVEGPAMTMRWPEPGGTEAAASGPRSRCSSLPTAHAEGKLATPPASLQCVITH